METIMKSKFHMLGKYAKPRKYSITRQCRVIEDRKRALSSAGGPYKFAWLDVSDMLSCHAFSVSNVFEGTPTRAWIGTSVFALSSKIVGIP